MLTEPFRPLNVRNQSAADVQMISTLSECDWRVLADLLPLFIHLFQLERSQEFA